MLGSAISSFDRYLPLLPVSPGDDTSAFASARTVRMGKSRSVSEPAETAVSQRKRWPVLWTLVAVCLFSAVTWNRFGQQWMGRVTVPDLVNLSQEEAVSVLARSGLKVGKLVEEDSPALYTKVVGQYPSSNASLPKGTAIDLTVAQSIVVPMPDVIGLDLISAEKKIRNAGLVLEDIRKAVNGPDPDMLPGTIARCWPRAAHLVNRGQRVTLYLLQ